MESVFRPPPQLNFSGNVSENWQKFKQRFELFMEATGKTKEDGKTQVAILLNLIGEDGIEVFNTFKLEKEESEDLSAVLKTLEKFCQPLKNVIFERYKFLNSAQREGRTFDSFLTELQTATASCEFKEDEAMVQDRIVLGITNKNLQERLLREADLTFKKAAEFCRAAEVSRKQASALQGNNGEVCVVQQKNSVVNRQRPSSAQKQSSVSRPMAKSDSFVCKKCAYTHKPKACPAYKKGYVLNVENLIILLNNVRH